MKDYSSILAKELKKSKDYLEALALVRANSTGKIYLIGSSIFKTLTKDIYGIETSDNDFDFIVEGIKNEWDLPKGWTVSKNRFGNPKLVFNEKQIDIVPINNIQAIESRGAPRTIESFLKFVPLNIQAFAFDIGSEKILGSEGIKALEEKVVRVNDKEYAKIASNKKGFKSVKDFIDKKAKELGFKSEYVTTS